MNGDELLLIAHQATYLAERFAGEWIPRQDAASQRAAQARLERWCHLAAGGDWGRFGERLAWDGLDLDRARRLLTDGYLADGTAPPAWTGILAEAVAQAASTPLPPDPALVVQPFLTVAQRRLQQVAGAKLLWLAPVTQERLTTYLRQQLCQAAAPTLEFTGWQSLSALCHTYPVLARQLATQVMQWVDACVEFLQRLAADWPLLVADSGQDLALAPGVITDLQPGLSDRHAGGRTVWAVTIRDSGHTATTLAYKPKALTMDRAWNELLAWCNAQGLAPQLDTLWTLPCAGYGWMAWAATQPTAPADQLRYYQRVGMLLGLLHLLQATDCHAENLVTQGDQLFLVDAEMLRYPQISGQQHADPLDLLRTGLLPRWRVEQQGVAEISGLTSEQKIGEQKVDACAVVAGYTQMMRFLAANWAKLNGNDGPLAAFRQGSVRFAPRPTDAYLRLLAHLRHPTFLRRGADFSLGVDQLAHTYLNRPAHRPFWPLLAAEHAALNQGDLPYFTVTVGQPALTVGAQRIATTLDWPPLTLPTALVQEQQCALIRESLDRTAYLPTYDRPASLLAQAIHLGNLLVQRAVPLARGGLGWIANQRQAQSGLYQHRLVGDDLYSGRAGIALFLAALYRVTGDASWRRAALAGLHVDQPDQATCYPDLDGKIYAFSQAAALLATPELLNMAIALSQQVSERQTNARQINTHQILTCGVLDGEAGLLLALLALSHQLPTTNQRATVTDLAFACGDTLLAIQSAWRDQERGLGGFSHGAAGIGYALAALAAHSGAARFQTGAAAGWAMQKALYDELPGNWQDRRGATPVYLDNWCNGAAGIGLAAAASVPVLPQLAAVVERAAALLIAHTRSATLDTLCCGRFGQIESLLEMGVLLAQPTWVAQAIQLAQSALPAANTSGHFRLYDDLPPHLFNPTFFRGVAGIGYTFLRLAAASGEIDVTLPCVLRWGACNDG